MSDSCILNKTSRVERGLPSEKAITLSKSAFDYQACSFRIKVPCKKIVTPYNRPSILKKEDFGDWPLLGQ
jgi:hypothetical protein